MDKKKKKLIQRIITLLCIAILVLTLVLLPVLTKNEVVAEGPQASILSGKAESGSIQQKIIGGGTLAEEEAISVSVPSSVKLTEFLVKNNQAVQKGDAIASVDRVTVMSAIKEVQETLDLLAEDIEEESKKDTNEDVIALAGGTVKILYATEGATVQSVMLEHGALAVLNLDGLMAVDLTAETTLAAGKPVSVTLASGTVVEGKIAQNLLGEVTVTIEDNGYAIGDSVQITDPDGNTIGSGQLYIYSPWSASAYTGTIQSVKVSVGDKIRAGKTLMTIADAGYSAKYQKLLGQRRTYEDLLLRLFAMYQTETVTSPSEGIVTGIDTDSAQLLSSNEKLQATLLANSPEATPEFANFIGKISSIGKNGWALEMSEESIAVTDYKLLPADLVKNASLTKVALFNPTPAEGAPIPVYQLVDGEWQALEPDKVGKNDVLLFTVDEEGEPVWVVRIEEAAEESDRPSDGSTTPNTPTTPEGGSSTEGTTTPEQNQGATTGGSSTTRPGGSNFADSVVPNQSGTVTFPSGGSFGSGSYPQIEAEPEEELFSTEVTRIATVTPQNTMSLEISVDELDINSLKTGMEAVVKINALGGEKVASTITHIGSVGTNNGGSSKFTVTLSLARSENMLAGMNATAILIPSTAEDSVTIPAKALVEEGTKTIVYTAYDEKNEKLTNPVEVTVGASDGENVQILEGLKVGDTYYYAYYDTLVISSAPDFASGGSFDGGVGGGFGGAGGGFPGR